MPTVLITGGHKGLGLEATRTIAARGGYDIIMAGRNIGEVDAAAHDLRNRYGATIRTLTLDVASLASVRSGADAVRSLVREGSVAPLQVLLLNAGAQFRGPIEYSVDGHELTFATNCLGHFLLLNLLQDLVHDGGRIVFTASGTHDPDTMDGKMVGKAVEPDAYRLANDGRMGKPLSGGIRYSTSKLCTMLHAYELDRRLRAAGSSIQSIAFDPGLIVETGLMRTAPSFARGLMRTSGMKWMLRRMGVTMGSITFSGASLAKVAIDPAFAAASGKYIQSKNGQLIEARSSVMSQDKGRAHKLWMDCEQIVGIG
ncbi:SDR family NAD(P)-dependent oxidoreductase [Pelagibacterium sp. H642]|uniref:SDR family NAD(P)-dependent oxidoreductase n=1 Tax=Pelagibacterium sp. H642 TaxID=1881069 RepID=UPI002815A7A9|nr:SDR family NAD(P)-dependent oxidoreductase [Pelagibacterium sp. H642]WMT91428.1 SDR family NAD(P)-dependent oxidoreductase [Pelagibacterium sp. H642]